MWWPCLLLALIAIHLKASNGSAGAEPSGGGRYRHLSDALPLRVLSQQAAEAGRVVGEEIQQRLEPLERCRTRVFSFLRESLSLPRWNQDGQSSGSSSSSSSRTDLAQTQVHVCWSAACISLQQPEQERMQESPLWMTNPRCLDLHPAEVNEGLRKALSAQRQARSNSQSGRENGAGWSLRALGRRMRFGSGLDGMRDLLEAAAAGNHPEIHPEEAADRLSRMIEKNQRELRWHITKANGLLMKWASQASTEERRLEARLSEMRRAQRAVLSEVVTAAEARLQKAALETQIEGVRREWSDRQAVLKEQLGRRQQEIAQRMRAVTSDSKIMAKIYDEFLMRKKNEKDTSDANEDTFRRALELILEDTEEGKWEQVVSAKNGGRVTVQRKFLGRNSAGGKSSSSSNKFACIRAWCTMEVPAEAIAELFESSERVKEYNKWFLEGRDLELLDDDTKVVWASSPAPPLVPFVKPRDFVTVVNVRRLEDGSIVVVNRGYKHPAAPPSDEYVRGEVVLAANIIRPDSKNRNRTHFTMLTQVDPGGIAPAWIVNKISERDPVDFLERVEAAAGWSVAAAKIKATPPPASPTAITDTNTTNTALLEEDSTDSDEATQQQQPRRRR
ncbi:unnamed protein product [Pylaiella littoralis]